MKVLYPDFDVDEYLSTPNNDTLIERDALNKVSFILSRLFQELLVNVSSERPHLYPGTRPGLGRV